MPPAPDALSAERRLRLAIAVALAAGTLLLYARTAGFPFIHLDDHVYVEENPFMARGLGWTQVAWAFRTLYFSNWHPLTWISYLADVSIFGARPGPMHLVNAALHAASAAVLFLALVRMTGATWRSALVAALFALHPTRVESVAWVSERKDVLSVLFGNLTLLAWQGYARHPGPRRYALVVLAFAASLLSKAMLVTFPILLLLLDLWPLGRLRTRAAEGASVTSADAEVAAGGPDGPSTARAGFTRLLLEKVPLLALSAVASAMAILAQGQARSIVAVPAGLRAGNAVVSIVRYAGKVLWPSGLAVFYPFREQGYPGGQLAAALGLLIGVTAAAAALRRRAPWLLVGWLWFVGTLVPVLGVVQVSMQAIADRYTYFPSIGLFLALAWGVGAIRAPSFRRVAPWAAAGWLLALAVASHRQIGLWQDSERLFRHAIEVTEPNAVARRSLGSEIYRSGRWEEARVELAEAVRIRPDAASLALLGAACRRLGRLEEAEAAFRAALELDPSNDGASLGLDDLLVQGGRSEEGTEVLLRGARARRAASMPDVFVRVAIDVAARLVERGRGAEAIPILEQALAAAPHDAEALALLAAAWWGEGDAARAERYASEALATGRAPDRALLVQGAARTARGDFSGAAEALERAVQAEPEEPMRRMALAGVLGRAGRCAEACASLDRLRGAARTPAVLRERAQAEAAALGCGDAGP
jgi:Flp pilus assembly protein TadD